MVEFAPPQNPSFEYVENAQFRTRSTRTVAGYERQRPRIVVAPRAAVLNWSVTDRTNVEYVRDFYHRHRGRGRVFEFRSLNDEASPTSEPPNVGEVAGGALTSQPPYFAAFSWYNGVESLESLPSPEATFTVQDNFLLTVTVPPFISGADSWRVYVGTTTGDLDLQATETSRTWTMPTGGLIVGASPPTTNTLKPLLRWTFADRLTWRKIRTNRFRMQVEINEVFF